MLKKPLSWTVQYKALFLRCVTECSNSRKATRALQQLESLYLDFTKESPKVCIELWRLHFCCKYVYYKSIIKVENKKKKIDN